MSLNALSLLMASPKQPFVTLLITGKPKGPDIAAQALGYDGEPDRDRTCDPLIKSQLLYQLSYRPITGRVIRGAGRDGQVQKP